MIRPKPVPTLQDIDKSLPGGPCFCCRRRDDGVAAIVDPRNRWDSQSIIWSCLDHIPLARKALRMPRPALDAYEQDALQEAGAAGGEYLDSLGKTDLGQLSEVEYVTFLRTVLDTFGDDLAKRLASFEAPF